MPASSKARRTPMSDTHAPAPAARDHATRRPSNPSTGRARSGGSASVGSTGRGRSIRGSGNSARRVRHRKPGSIVAFSSSVRSRTQPKPSSTL
jgi:hypothetical protein